MKDDPKFKMLVGVTWGGYGQSPFDRANDFQASSSP